MIEKNNRIIDMLKNIIHQTQIILDDFERNGKVHYDYILEKLYKADWDMGVLIRIAEMERNKEEEEEAKK